MIFDMKIIKKYLFTILTFCFLLGFPLLSDYLISSAAISLVVNIVGIIGGILFYVLSIIYKR